MPSDKPSHNWKPEWNIDLFATRLQSSHPAHTLVIVNKQLHTGIDLALFSIHCISWSQNLFDCSSQSEKCKKSCRIRFAVAHKRGIFTNIWKIKSKAEDETIFDHVRQLFYKNPGVRPRLTSSKRPRPVLVAGEGFNQYYSSKAWHLKP